jgi:uncharacterized protein (DUF1330 family)
MSAYVVVDLDVRDPEPYAEYRRLAPSTMKPFGGRYLARGGETTVMEGAWAPKRMVILEFPDADAARAWYASEAYQAIVPIRQTTTDTHMFVILEGVTAPVT